MRDTKKNILKKIYKFCFDHFLIEKNIFCFNRENVIKNNKKILILRTKRTNLDQLSSKLGL